MDVTVAVVFVGVCLAGIALSVKSAVVLGTSAPWTSAGWWLTVVYFAAAIGKIAAHRVALPLHAEYIALVALTVAFIVAGVRDERQAEPWWWPTRRGATRAEKRTARRPV